MICPESASVLKFYPWFQRTTKIIRVETPTYIRGHWQGKVLNKIDWFFAPPSDHLVKKLVNRLLDVRLHRLNMIRDEERLNHGSLVHVGRGVHIDEGGFVFGGCFGAGAEFREAWSRAFLFMHRVGHFEFSGPRFCVIHLGQARVCGYGADVFVLCHKPCHRAVEELDARDGVCGAEPGVFGWRLEAGGAFEGERGELSNGHFTY